MGTTDLTSIPGVLKVSHGGTGQTTFTNGIVKVSGNTLSGNSTISLATDVGGTLAVANGGTGQATFTNGVVKVSGNTFSGNSTISLTTDVGGTLALANGGTGTSALPPLSALPNVTFSNLTASQGVMWDGTKWTNSNFPGSSGNIVLLSLSNAGTPTTPTVYNQFANITIGDAAAITQNSSAEGSILVIGARAQLYPSSTSNIGRYSVSLGADAYSRSGIAVVIGKGCINGAYGVCINNLTSLAIQQTYNSYVCCIGPNSYTVLNGSNFGICIGSNNALSGFNSVCIGTNVSAFGGSTYTTSNYATSIQGIEQFCRKIVRKSTTNNSSTALRNTGASDVDNNLLVKANTGVNFNGYIIARESVTTANNVSVWKIKGMIKQGATAGTTLFVGTPTVTLIAQDSGLSTCTVTLSTDTTYGALNISVTGISANINWLADIDWTAVTYA